MRLRSTESIIKYLGTVFSIESGLGSRARASDSLIPGLSGYN